MVIDWFAIQISQTKVFKKMHSAEADEALSNFLPEKSKERYNLFHLNRKSTFPVHLCVKNYYQLQLGKILENFSLRGYFKLIK